VPVQEVGKQKVHQIEQVFIEQIQWIKGVVFLLSVKSGCFYEPTYSEYFYAYVCTQCNKKISLLDH